MMTQQDANRTVEAVEDTIIAAVKAVEDATKKARLFVRNGVLKQADADHKGILLVNVADLARRSAELERIIKENW